MAPTFNNTLPIFNRAFANAYAISPPGSTPLLKPTPRIRLVVRNAIFDYACATENIIGLQPCHTKLDDNRIPTELSTNEEADIPNSTSSNLYSSTSLVLFSNNTFHCTNLFDLRICLSRMTPSQRAAIRVLKIRWYTAECALWEKYHPDHACKTSSEAIGMLTGLERLVVAECERRKKSEVREMKEELEGWIGGSREDVVVEMEGFVEGKVEDGWSGWASGGGWGFYSLGG
jgi:hypothetical protein